jgi:hypothetical protein
MAPSSAWGSNLVARNTKGVSLKVNSKGVALVQYREKNGARRRVLYWGAVNWSTRFKYDRSGGWKSHKASWKKFRNGCRPYDGPALSALVAACKAPDGSYWALQDWVRIKPNYGGRSGRRELRISHWTGWDLPRIWIKTDWSWHGRFHHLYGQYTYRGRPVVPGKVKSSGYVLDGIGRNIAIEAWNSDMGRGWVRVNMILAHYKRGQFCFGFTPKGHGPRTGKSKSGIYRASTAGAGVGPDIVGFPFRGQAGRYNSRLDRVANEEQRRLSEGSSAISSCKKFN